MHAEPIRDIEHKLGRTKYTCGPVVFIKADAGAILADHEHPESETLWIISGKGKMQTGDQIYDFEGPCTLIVPANIYHKFMPSTDVDFIEERHRVGNT